MTSLIIGYESLAIGRKPKYQHIDISSISDPEMKLRIKDVLTLLAAQLELKINGCIESTYNEIKGRKGRMENEVFIKEEHK